jgi:septal ring factor EnvC (AmiA/AmiB activator)
MIASRLTLKTGLLAAASLLAGAGLLAQDRLDPALRVSGDPDQARAALDRAVREGKRAQYRAEQLEEDARRATERAERTASEAAAVAARVQETEARIQAREAQLRLMGQQRLRLDARLAKRQEPVIRLSAALQRLSRRPPILGLLRPGSVRDAVYLRALLDTLIPQVEAQTAALREELAKVRDLAEQQAVAAASLKREQGRLLERQRRLAAIETQQRLDSRRVAGIASRENERALALAERARDLEDLVKVVGQQGRLRAQLSALPGPVLRPLRPQDSRVAATIAAPSPRGLESYILPVVGQLVTGFAEPTQAGRPSNGIVLAARGGAQVVAPANGQVAFAGPYRGFGRIVIIEHAGDWTTLVTGLARLDVEAGERLVAGSPLGVVEPASGQVRLELRRGGEPVNPLLYMRGT